MYVRIWLLPWYKAGGTSPLCTPEAREWCEKNGWFWHVTLCRWQDVQNNPRLRRRIARASRRWHNQQSTLDIDWVYETGTATIHWRGALARDPEIQALRNAGPHRMPLTILMGW